VPKRILIVDDEKSITMTFRRLLEIAHSDYEIEEAHGGSQAFRRLMQGSFDLVLLDYMMPDVRGDKVCEMIRSEERLKDLPIVIVTAYHDQTEAKLKAWGATEVLYKPVEGKDILNVIRKYLS
jgi:CheY-like chemotaxis protein